MTAAEFAAARRALGWSQRDAADHLAYAGKTSIRPIETGTVRLSPARTAHVEAWLAWNARRLAWVRENPMPPATMGGAGT
jgi:ribosome-binding protein aMBF1 (putative translation factor)